MTRVFVLWNESYSVGIKLIDEQHKGLINILNKLYESFIDQTVGKMLEEIIRELVDYTKYHFNTEERLFTESNYPDKEKHIIEHQEFVEKVNKFKTDLENGKSSLTFQLMNFLRNWLLNHIAMSDQAYASHFRAKGIK
ncbi:MAG: hemerythrin family protein [Chloroflexia bacterium]|nr:hemerythrin family protein [Chloroflexia bacterium]